MSFFKKLKAELKEMLNDDDDKDKKKIETKDETGATSHDQTKDIHNQPPPNTDRQSQQSAYPQYGNAPPPSGPQLPPGWISQWDQNSQRNYYVEQATGRTQWELPMWPGQGGPPSAPPGGPGYYQSYGQAMPPGMPYQQGHDEHQQAYYGGVQSQEKKGSGMGKVVAAGVGGAAVGALAANALDDSDDEHRAAPAAAPYGYGAPPPTAAPVPLEDNPELSSSQRSSLQEAREDLDDAQEKVAEEGSDASSSDLEELQEAREEYHSEVEDAEEELED